MTRTSHSIVARYPLWGFLLMTAISLVAIHLCADLRFFHQIKFSSGISARSPWFWVIFGGFIALLLYSLGQMILRPALLQADLSGLQLGHRAWGGKIFVKWEDVLEINQGNISGSSENGPTTPPAIRFVVNTRENLGGVISGMTQAEGNSVCFAASLFADDTEETIRTLHQIRADALGQRLS